MRWLHSIIAILLVVCILTPTTSWAARQTNGTNQSLQSASALSYSLATKLGLSFWLYWDTFGNNDHIALESSTNFNSGGAADYRFNLNPNSSATSNFTASGKGETGSNTAYATRPSAAAWHHVVVCFDILQAANEVFEIYIDGTSQSLTHSPTSNNTAVLGNQVLYLMSRGNSSLWAAGRIASVALWTGGCLSSGNVTDVNNGVAPTSVSVSGGTLINYWKLCGTDSPELPTTGSINMTVNGATQVAHPSAISAECTSAVVPKGMILGVHP